MTKFDLDWLAYSCDVQLVCCEDFINHTVTMDVIGRKKKVQNFISVAEERRPISFVFYYNETHTGVLAFLKSYIDQWRFKFERR